MNHITPPTDDEQLSRHRFYTIIAAHLSNIEDRDNESKGSRTRLHARVDSVEMLAKNTKDSVTEITTKNKTIASIIVGFWIVAGGAIGWSLDKTVTRLDNYTLNIEKSQRAIELLQKDIAGMQSQKDQIEALKRVTAAMQSEIDELRTSKGRDK